MNETEILLVQESFEKLILISKKVTSFFYSRLNDLDSSINLPKIGNAKEMATDAVIIIGKIVENLNNFETIVPELHAMGLKNRDYNFQKDSYNTIGVVFIDTLSNGFGHDFTPKLMNAWVKVYKKVTATMIEGAGY